MIIFSAATADSKAIEKDFDTVVKKSLRTQAPSEGEERGVYESVQVARYKLKFPGWLAKGRDPAYVASKKLKLTFPYVNDPLWKVYKSYKKAYDKRQSILFPAGM
ncbi:hypothetical protein DVH05_004901 [Phytophthora capsici]|nr:hypothetical protein DVH05_004901 [Phytophthora capsici]